MRLDFREERRWKLALAYNLAHAVLEWHEAGTIEERVRRGICVLWRKPRAEDMEVEDCSERNGEELDFGPRELEEDNPEDSKENSTPANDYGSDDESDDEQEKEQQDVLDALEPTTAVQDALETALSGLEASSSQQTQSTSSQPVHPKVEDIEDLSALQGKLDLSSDAMETDAPSGAEKGLPKAEPSDGPLSTEASGLKISSTNPILGTRALQVSKSSSAKAKTKTSVYAPLREQIVYSDLDKLFIDFDDLDITKAMSELTTDDPSVTAPPPPVDLSAIFPDLQPYGLLDVAPIAGPSSDGKRKSDRRGDRDDPNKRAEDTTYSKLVPMSGFMHSRPTLISALQPARHWSKGQWVDLDEVAVVADFDTPNARTVDDSVHSSEFFPLGFDDQPCLASYEVLFESNGPRTAPSIIPPSVRRRTPHELEVARQGAGYRHRHAEVTWTTQDDAILKQLVDKYPNNWTLVAEAFNTARGTISTDKRTSSECQERWRTRLVGNAAIAEEDVRAPPQTPTTQMTTRGTKRSMSVSTPVSATSSASALQGEPRKRRRHNLIHEAIRKATKKRDQAQKIQGASDRHLLHFLDVIFELFGYSCATEAFCHSRYTWTVQ